MSFNQSQVVTMDFIPDKYRIYSDKKLGKPKPFHNERNNRKTKPKKK
jgi:hypothetical protein